MRLCIHCQTIEKSAQETRLYMVTEQRIEAFNPS